MNNQNFNVQSVIIGTNYILVGTKNGNIYELKIPSIEEK